MTRSNHEFFYCYGVANTHRGPICFISKNKKHGYRDIIIEESAVITAEEAHNRAWELLNKHLGTPTRTLMPGSVADHTDDVCAHRAIVIDIDNQLALALFISSNPHWNPHARLASKEELAIAGYHAKQASYLIPVIRSIKDFIFFGLSFPDYRLQELREEFPWSSGDVVHG